MMHPSPPLLWGRKAPEGRRKLQPKSCHTKHMPGPAWDASRAEDASQPREREARDGWRQASEQRMPYCDLRDSQQPWNASGSFQIVSTHSTWQASSDDNQIPVDTRHQSLEGRTAAVALVITNRSPGSVLVCLTFDYPSSLDTRASRHARLLIHTCLFTLLIDWASKLTRFLYSSLVCLIQL